MSVFLALQNPAEKGVESDNEPVTPPRLTDFDGLRGWLALGVVLSHVAGFAWTPQTLTERGPTPLLDALWNLGSPAVDAFFVLSGIVVGLSIERAMQRGFSYRAYLSRRLRRLLPLNIVGILLGLLCIRPLGHLLGPGAVHDHLTSPLRTSDWTGIAALGMLNFDSNRLNPPLWSLTVELQVALLMPLLLLAAQRLRWGAVLLVPLCIGLIFLFGTPLFNLWYVPVFLLGIALRHTRVTRPAATALLIGGFLLWQHRLITGDHILFRYTAALGAGAMLTGLQSLSSQGGGVVSAFLSLPLSQFLGKISFSLYATHFLPLTAGAALLGQAPAVGAACAVPVALLLGWLCYQYVERRLSP